MLSQLAASTEVEPVPGSTRAGPEWEEEMLMCGNQSRRHPRDERQRQGAGPPTFSHSTLQPHSEQLRTTRIILAVTFVLFTVCYLDSQAHSTLSFSVWEASFSAALGCLDLFFSVPPKPLGEAEYSQHAVRCRLTRMGAP